MTLEQLIAELQALSLACPPETQVYFADARAFEGRVLVKFVPEA